MSINAAALASAQETERQLGLITVHSIDLVVAMGKAKDCTDAVANIKDPVKNAEYYGAKGDGVTDDTDAINRMFATGVAIFDQYGKTYLIDAVKRITIPKDGTTLRVLKEKGAVRFVAKTNDQPKYRLFNTNASNCDLDFGGAEIRGDRDSHIWKSYGNSTDTHEWGYCLFIGGSNNKVYSSSGNAVVTKCTGDGIGTTGPGHEVFGFEIVECRRQGCSAFNPAGLQFHDNKVWKIGLLGQPDKAPKTLIGPFSAFDAEPDQGDALNLKIYNNELGPDCRTGAQGWINSRAAAITPTMKITGQFYGNTIIGCSNGSWFCCETAGKGTIIFELFNNRWVNNKNTDVKCDQGSVITIGDAVDQGKANVFDDTRDQADGYKKGFVNTRGEMQALRGAKVNAGWNLYV